MTRDLILIQAPRYADHAAWVEDLRTIATEILAYPADCRPAAALAPAARWAARREDVEALRRIAEELADQSPDWEALRALGLRARAALAAEPNARS